MSYRIGQGYDAHQLKPKLSLTLGGVNIPHNKGIVAHSDGDILIHSIIDAILGACNLGDIGALDGQAKESYEKRKKIKNMIFIVIMRLKN